MEHKTVFRDMHRYRPAIIAIIVYSALLLLSFHYSIREGLGRAESLHDPSCSWLYIRRLLLIAAALLAPQLSGMRGFGMYGWHISLRWLGIAVALGIVIGFGNKGGFDPRHPSALALACFHAGATELFFRAYLISAFSRSFSGFWLPVILASLLYGIFYMTVWTAWHQQPLGRLLFIVLFSLIGLIHGYCYKKSKSFFVPWIMHFLGVLRYRLFL
ncbi:MAG: CPBP family intramembrane metalloprotease [Desulfobacterota bacterium]|nr:CPBP family intramembrane metalloprotease [Thermodesulfobacteriota bacterium]